MIRELRADFNARWTPERYRAFLAHLDRRAGTPVKFRVSETPCFLPQALVDRLAATGAELLRQLIENPAYRAASDATIPPEFRAPNEAPAPLFAAVDFNLVRNAAGELEPRLIELQGFPSLYGFQTAFAQSYIEAYGLDASLRVIPDGSSLEIYCDRLRRAILGGHDPQNVVLMEIHPLEQKTLPDFVVTERITGIRTVCITEIEKQGRELFYRRDGRRTPIRRIYNRVIVDELQRKQVTLPFRYTDVLDVEWAGHPNWFFRISKFSLPYLQHPCVPRTCFLDAFDFSAAPSDAAAAKAPEGRQAIAQGASPGPEGGAQRPASLSQADAEPAPLRAQHHLMPLPADLENYVLKPLYSFAGLGVVVGPARADLDSIPASRRHDYILQERMRFEPVIETPHGPTQAEIRVLYILPEQQGARGEGLGAREGSGHSPLHLGPLIIRMGRGKMMGVDHNRDLEWVGASAALITD